MGGIAAYWISIKTIGIAKSYSLPTLEDDFDRASLIPFRVDSFPWNLEPKAKVGNRGAVPCRNGGVGKWPGNRTPAPRRGIDRAEEHRTWLVVRNGLRNEIRSRCKDDGSKDAQSQSISTTTNNQLEIDDETRHISIWVDASRKRNRRVARATVRGVVPLTGGDLKVWHEAQRLIEARAKMSVKSSSCRTGSITLQTRSMTATSVYGEKLSEDQLAALTARQANAAFGGLNYKMLGRNKTLQDVLRLAFMAPDFTEARARFAGQAAKPYGREQLAALVGGAVAFYVLARILNEMLDKDPPLG